MSLGVPGTSDTGIEAWKGRGEDVVKEIPEAKYRVLGWTDFDGDIYQDPQFLEGLEAAAERGLDVCIAYLEGVDPEEEARELYSLAENTDILLEEVNPEEYEISENHSYMLIDNLFLVDRQESSPLIVEGDRGKTNFLIDEIWKRING